MFWIRFRIVLIVLLLLTGAVMVAQGAWSLAVERREELTGMAREQYTRRLQLSARRGMILDRHGEELAVEVEVDSIYVDPREVTDPATGARKLSAVLQMDETVLTARLSSKRHFAWLQRRVSPEVSVAVRALAIPGVHIVKEGKRFYPGRRLAAGLIGFAGMDSKGLEGIERLYEEKLQGSQDTTAGLVDAGGRVIFSTESMGNEGVVGSNIVLTIDRNLQFVVEEELEKTVRLFQARAGHVVAMDPHTGEVLAMASWPTFNPNQIQQSDAESRRNRPVLDVFEPGSTFKVFTLAAALNAGTLRPDEMTYCERGRLEFYDAVINDEHRDGWLNPTQCLKRSSNICFVKMAGKLGSGRMHEYLRRFGFGEKTGLQVPFESRGLMPHQRRWTEFLNATISFGQGIGVTNLQMTTALSAIANGGNLMLPTLVKQVTDSRGEMVQAFSPVVRRRVISARTARLVTDMMTAVTEEGGTGTGAAIDGYLVAGKTGTAQKSVGARGYEDRERFVASFFGFVPADKPRLVISVVIDEPVINYYGGTVAAPLMGRIADRALRDMGISPGVVVQRPDQRRKTPSVEETGKAQKPVEGTGDVAPETGMMATADLPMKQGQVRTPDLIGLNMNETLKQLAETGLRPYFMGTGVAVEQVPENGYPLDKGDFVQVNFSSPGTRREME